MKLKLQAKDLSAALDIAGIVSPKPVTAQGGAGFLFVVSGGSCYIHSRDSQHQARVEVPAEDIEGEGSFIFPADKIGSLKYVGGWVEFECGHDTEDDRFWVRYRTQKGANADRATIDPRLMQPLDEALGKATHTATYPAAILREGLNQAKNFLAKDGRAAENFKTLQIFDASQEKWAKGDGHLFAADGVRACYFFCEAFCGKGLNIHGQHLGPIMAFLAKSSGDVDIKIGDGVTFAINANNQVLGWAHHVKQHEKFSYYPYSWDGFILRAPKDLLLNALRYVRAGLDAKRDKIRITYTHSDNQMSFITSEGSGKDASEPVTVTPIVDAERGGGELGASADFAVNVNIDMLLDVIEPLKANEVELRVTIVPAKEGRKEAHLLRTIDEFWLDSNGKLLISPGDSTKAFACRVTRFMPSRE